MLIRQFGKSWFVQYQLYKQFCTWTLNPCSLSSCIITGKMSENEHNADSTKSQKYKLTNK